MARPAAAAAAARTPAGFERQRALAATLPGATEDIKWGADLVFSVGGKMFCVLLLHEGVARSCSFKVDSDRFLELSDLPGFKPAPYLARAHWVQVEAGHTMPAPALDELVRRSHALVAGRLTKKLQQQLGLS